jgi:CDP-glucose 4,6-dehydratase
VGAEVSGVSIQLEEQSTLFDQKSLEDLCPSQLVDVTNQAELLKALKKNEPEVIIHLAAQALVINGYEQPHLTFSTNTMGTVNVLEASRSLTNLKALIIITTDKVYAREGGLLDENSVLGGSDPYSSSKVAAEEAVRGYRPFFRALGIPITIFRGGNIIGGGDWSRNRLIPDIVKAHRAGIPIEIRNPNATRPWQHVLDLSWSYVLAANASLAGQGDRVDTVFNVGPKNTDSRTVAEVLKRAVINGFENDLRLIESDYSEAHNLAINSSKALRVLEWEPQLDFEESVNWTFDWYRDVLNGVSTASEKTDAQIALYVARIHAQEKE